MKDLLKGLGCLLGGFLLLFIVIIGLLHYVLWQDEKDEEKRLEQLMIIPSNGNGELSIEHKYTDFDTFDYKGATYICRDTIHLYRYDFYYVYNYKPADSLFMFSYIDSLTFDKSNDVHQHIFYLYDTILPKKGNLNLHDYSCKRFAYWSFIFEKKQFDGINWEAYIYTRYHYPGDKNLSSVGDTYHFVYDKEKRKFRLSTSYKQAVCHTTDGTEFHYILYY